MEKHHSGMLTMYTNKPEDYYVQQMSSHGLRGRWFRKRQSTAYELIRKYRAGGLVLDMGCGNCLWHREGIFSAGIDINHAMLKYNQRRLPSFSPLCADIAAGLPIKSHSVDTVVIMEVLEHFKDHGAILDEVLRVLKPGGHVIVSVPYGKFPGLWSLVFPLWCQYKWLSEHDEYYRDRCGHVVDFNSHNLRQALKRFKCVEILSIHSFTLFMVAKKEA